MSGGSHNYICYKIEEELVGSMEDRELDDLMQDVADLAHDLEWYHSADTSKEDYRKAVAAFKKKWFEDAREPRLMQYVDEEIDKLRAELRDMISGAGPQQR